MNQGFAKDVSPSEDDRIMIFCSPPVIELIPRSVVEHLGIIDGQRITKQTSIEGAAVTTTWSIAAEAAETLS